MNNNNQNNMQQQAKVVPISLAPGWDTIIDNRVPGWLLPLMDKMKMLKYLTIKNMQKLIFFLLVLGMASCKKESLVVDDIQGLGGDTWEPTAIDTWINDSLTTPYNIAVKYKWDQAELSTSQTLVPPKEEKIIPVLSAVKKVWINTYQAEAGAPFIKTYCPKFFALAGSASWNTDGTITLGTAEGGRKIVLYVLNDFRTKGMTGYVPSDSNNIKQMFHTIEHEFGHILHQTVYYPIAFKQITVGLYTSNWNNVTDAEARQDGFVTAYAMSATDEDFVEMIAMMLIEGKAGFDAIVNSIPAGTSSNGTTQAQAQSRLRQKEAMVVNYYKDTWGIDFYSLQTRVRGAVESLIK
jgi:substrate import-associated zinc metallohydrolase lipoprotein